jgi:hypothetical protein
VTPPPIPAAYWLLCGLAVLEQGNVLNSGQMAPQRQTLSSKVASISVGSPDLGREMKITLVRVCLRVRYLPSGIRAPGSMKQAVQIDRGAIVTI